MLFAVIGIGFWWFALPFTPFVLIGMIVGGSSAQKPQNPSGRKTDPPLPEDLNRYHKWKDMLAGIVPFGCKDWTSPNRVFWWMGWLLGLLVTPARAVWWVGLVNMLCSFVCVMGAVHWLNRRKDRRHVYKGVSITAFFSKAPKPTRILVFCATGVMFTACLAAWWFESLPLLGILLYPALVFLLLVWATCKKAQSKYWLNLVKYQTLLDGWIGGDDLKKAWAGAYLTQANELGDADNPLIVLRVRLQGGDGKQRSVQDVFKVGVEKIKAPAAESGYRFVSLLGAKQRKKGAVQFDPSSVRIVMGADESCIPDVTKKTAGEKLVSLVADIAYTKTAEVWHKRAPLTEAHDVSADEEQAAWLLQLFLPPENSDPIDKISLEWMSNDGNPSETLKLPIFSDLQNAFHLAAMEDTPLSDDGNKWRAGDTMGAKSFDAYVNMSRRFKREQFRWADLVGNKLPIPSPNYDNEETYNCGGWQLIVTPITFAAPSTAADYARLDLTPLDPMARFITVIGDGGQSGYLIKSLNGAPTRIDMLNGSEPHLRVYAQALVFKALVDVMPSKVDVAVDSCTQEGKDVSIWRVKFHLGRGGTVMDVRKQSAHVLSAVGANYVYWNWLQADAATLWMCRNRYLEVADLPHWKRPRAQKELIKLALSDAWGVAGVADASGRTPTVRSLGVLPSNHDVLLARFEIPAGLDVDKPQHNIGKFMTSADYAYGRILQRGTEHGATLYDMVLAKQSPFPTMVNADWDEARQAKPRMFPLGVDDMGKQVCWNVKDTFHLLICGKSGTGKSSAAQIVVTEALLKGHNIILIDPSKGCIDFTQWAKPLALAFVGLGQMREAEAAIAWLRHEMAERVALFSKYGVGSIYELDQNQLTEEERKHTQPIDLVFDEFNSWLQEAGKTTQNPNKDIQVANDNAAVSALNNSIRRTMSNLGKIVVQGRTAGISVILGAQRLTMDDMKPYNANAFFRSLGRILLGMDSPAGVVSQQNLREANRLQQSLKGEGGKIPQGRGIFETAQGQLLAVQTWYSGGQEKLMELVKDITPPEPIDYTPYMPAEAETYGEMSADELAELLNKPQEGEEINDMGTIQNLLHQSDETDDNGIEEVDW